MSPIEYIRHNYLGSTLSNAICDDPACRTKTGAKILHQEFHGYGEAARDMKPAEEQHLRNSATEHLRQHPDHNVRILIGHKENMLDEEKRTSKTIYEYKAPESMHG